MRVDVRARARSSAHAASLGVSVLLLADLAQAQACLSSRPTDPEGSQGLAYGTAEVRSFDSAAGRARVFYAATGVHSPPLSATIEGSTPDAVVVAAQAADDALKKYDELSFEAPRLDADSPCASNGQAGSELVTFVDASSGGIGGQDAYPWVYISLSSGAPVGLTDLEALASCDWDVAFKRFVLRTNSGDSGPGQGGALRVELPWESVDLNTLGTRMLPMEDWFDDDCNLTMDDQGELVTTFAGWHEYDLATHTLMPAPVVYLVRGAAGAPYKLAILDYYASPKGAQGTVPGRYKVRIAPLR